LNKYEEWDGRPIVRQHQSPIYWDDLKVLIHRRFELDIETGVGLQSGQGSDPQIMLQYSDDGGHTWSSERWTSIGKVGEYKSRASWRSLGRARERVYRVRISDPVNVTIMGGRVIAEITGNP
jgi:Neuraminidase (sialidase)